MEKKNDELGKNIDRYFKQTQKPTSSEKSEDIKKMSKAEMDTKIMLYKDSLKEVPIDEHYEPMFNGMFLTAKRNAFMSETGILLSNSIDDFDVKYDAKQRVMAVGPQVQQAEKGDEVVIDFDRFWSSPKENSLSEKLKKNQTKIVVPTIYIDDIEYLYVSERDLKYIIKK
jgi:hypothetical protein